MKKLAWLVALAAMGLVLSGCPTRSPQRTGPQGAGPGKKVKLTFSQAGTAKIGERFRAILKDFEASHPNIEVEYQPVQGRYYERVQTLIAGNIPPDIMWMGRGFPGFVYRGAFQSLQPFIDSDPDINLDDFFPTALSMYEYKGELYGFPYGVSSVVLFYNKDLFDREELSYPDDSWTWDTFLENAKKLTKDLDGDGRIDQFGCSGYWWTIALWQNGGEFVDERTRRCMLDQPEAIEATKWVFDLKLKWGVQPPRYDPELGAPEMFQTGRIAMYMGARWDVETFAENPELNFDVAVLPHQKKRATWISVEGLTISAKCKHPREAWEVIKYFVSDEVQKSMVDTTTPSRKKIAFDPEINKNLPFHNYRAFPEVLAYAHTDPRLSNVEEILTKTDEVMQQVDAGEITAKEACLEAKQQVDKILAEAEAAAPVDVKSGTD